MANELAQRTGIRAFRAGQYVLIAAEGVLPNPGYEVDIAQSPLKIFPPQFNLLRYSKTGFFQQVLSPYRYAETVRFPADQPAVTVHHAEGADQVDIEDCGEELSGYVQAVTGSADHACPEGADEAIGFSDKLSFDEAFAKALAGLPPVQSPGADALARVQVIEIGGLFGGIAGFNDLFVRICRTRDPQ
jgi:hypothetical protein